MNVREIVETALVFSGVGTYQREHHDCQICEERDIYERDGTTQMSRHVSIQCSAIILSLVLHFRVVFMCSNAQALALSTFSSSQRRRLHQLDVQCCQISGQSEQRHRGFSASLFALPVLSCSPLHLPSHTHLLSPSWLCHRGWSPCYSCLLQY